jgi:hypothetical protein
MFVAPAIFTPGRTQDAFLSKFQNVNKKEESGALQASLHEVLLK